MQQETVQSDSSPQPQNHGTESPTSEQTPANKDSSDPTPPQSPKSEDAEKPEEEPDKTPAEMTLDIKNIIRKAGEKTFTQRSRLIVGNIPLDMTEEAFKNMFAKYGNINEIYINRERGFGFVRLVGYSTFF